MKLKELPKVMDDKTNLNIDGQQYDRDVPEELIDDEVVKIDKKVVKPASDNLEKLGYSFEAGV